ncbi:MAG TPA: glycoside hydrolase family 3 N-terminal domain-containing protein [Candidatus Limnocylindrales bacterium]|nr:glycoside hydrolase family 3 N-terminal domain-containing protein [Candidatus Limnocylindrales bacterium]
MTTAAPPYRDPDASTSARVADLVARMTPDEKIAQLSAVWAFELVGDDGPDHERLRALAGNGLGEITRLAGSTNLRPLEVARAANAIQRFLVEETRLGIPAIIHEESLHGLLALDAACFQQSIGAGATFDPDLVGRVAESIRRRMLATGARHALGPVLDIARDPRWGRIEETYGEDPYLAAELGSAYVRGLQGSDLRDGVLATGKHLVGHGLAEGGLNQAPVHLGPREMQDEQFFPFETAVVDTGLASVMPAYCDVDGLPCHASGELFRTILRERWGFDGIVASDYAGIEMLQTAHHLTDDPEIVATMALEAGVDLELPRLSAYAGPLRAALEAGRVSEALLDEAVGRILRIKFRLGLFDCPYHDEPTAAELAELAEDEARVGLELARRSIVLVANDGILPLAPSLRRVAVIGPGADSPREFLGDYSHLVHVETLVETRRSRSQAFGIISEGGSVVVEDELAGRPTLLDALRARLDGCEVLHATGTGIHDGSDADIAAAADLARASDVAIVVVAERSGLTADSTTGEFRDRRDLGLFGRQQDLLDAVAGTGTPVVLVVVSGRPLALERAAAQSAAVLLAWVPGDAGPEAITDVLTGATDASGRLPVTMPRNVGQVPLTYRHHPTGGRSNPLGDYVDGPTSPLWPFGFGLSYTRFELSDLRLDRTAVPTRDGELTVEVDVVNVGRRAGDEVVQLYIRDEEATVARPVRELRGFRRVHLAPGERRTVAFTLHADQFAYTGADLRRVIEPGRVSLLVGRSSDDLPLQATIELVGPVVDLRVRRHFLTGTAVR